MIPLISIVALLIAGVIGGAVFFFRLRFLAQLDRLDQEIEKRDIAAGARSDLPPEVVALAARIGARPDGGASFAVFEQSGQMWQTPGGKPIDFTARQSVRIDAPGFVWRAATGRPFWILVVDYFLAGTGGLEVRLLGAFRVARMAGGAAMNQGEALRYLAELPWNPDAILANRSLEWTVLNTKTIKVATGLGAERGEVTFDLDDKGLVTRASAPSRLYVDKKGNKSTRPWQGRFWDYQRLEGRLIPGQGEVAWVLDSGEFVYWRGRILNWRSPVSTSRSERRGAMMAGV